MTMLTLGPGDRAHQPSDFFARVLLAIARGVVGFFRQSTLAQKFRNIGSQHAQEDQIRYLEPFGVHRQDVRVVLAYGESGSRDVVRRKFQELKMLVENGEVGLVVLARHDRLGRNEADSADLFEAMAEHGTLLMVDGRIYDPSDEGDEFILGIYAKFAEFENRARVRWMMMSRLAKAERLQARILLPTGLVWASPDDPDYIQQMESNGLQSWLVDLEKRHRAVSRVEGRAYYVLPYPDREVARSVELRLQWLLETRSLREVLRRIRTHPDWPRPGQLPGSAAGTLFNPARRPKWEPVQKHALYKWFQSPSLYGTYQFSVYELLSRRRRRGSKRTRTKATPNPRRSASPVRELPPGAVRVRVEGAFPGFASPSDEARVREILQNPAHRWLPRRCTFPRGRLHAIGRAYCGHEIRPGIRCGRTVRPRYPNNFRGRHIYRGGGCEETRSPHTTIVPNVLDRVVLDTLLDVFDPAGLKEGLQKVRVDLAGLRAQKSALLEQIEELEEEVEARSALVVQAQRAKKKKMVTHWSERLEVAEKALSRARASLANVQTDEAELAQAAEADLQRIIELGSDFPTLLERAHRTEGALQRLVAELTDRIYVCRLGEAVFEVEIVFPAGGRIRRIFFAGRFRSTQPARLWAFHRMREGTDPSALVEELTRLGPPAYRAARWTVPRVRGAALLHEHFETVVPRDGEHLSATEIGIQVGASADDVMEQAFQGRLGPARIKSGVLAFRPTEAELHRWFPSYALRQIAAQTGWPEGDTVLVADLRAELNLRWQTDRETTRRLGVVYDAAGRKYVRRSLMPKQWWNRPVAEDSRGGVRLHQAVAELGRNDLQVEEFIPYSEAFQDLRRRFLITRSMIDKAMREGHVPHVFAAGYIFNGCPRRIRYIHMPEWVRSAGEKGIVLAWLRGESPAPESGADEGHNP